MYGTVMIAKSSTPLEQLRSLVEEWADAVGRDAGFVDERVLRGADDRIVVCVRFRDEASYKALGDNPEQDLWWTTKMAPQLEGEPEWIDGTWYDM